MAVKKTVLQITGMHCSSCGMLIDEALEDVPGVRRSATKVRKGRTVVEFDDDVSSVETMIAAIVELGYVAAEVGAPTST